MSKQKTPSLNYTNLVGFRDLLLENLLAVTDVDDRRRKLSSDLKNIENSFGQHKKHD